MVGDGDAKALAIYADCLALIAAHLSDDDDGDEDGGEPDLESDPLDDLAARLRLWAHVDTERGLRIRMAPVRVVRMLKTMTTVAAALLTQYARELDRDPEAVLDRLRVEVMRRTEFDGEEGRGGDPFG